jgi:uncharacterized protein YjbI with pentapeptide repeats
MANPEHLELLKQGATEWNQWRKEQKKVIPDLKKANLSNLDLSTVNFKQANLEGANFSNSNLNNAQLVNANLQGANFLCSDLRGANLRSANLDYVIFSKAKIDSDTEIAYKSRQIWEIVNHKSKTKNLTKIDLSNANLFRADLSDLDLSHAKLNRANLNNANLKDAYLYKADLTGANLHNADLRNAYFSHANLTKAYLVGASCYGTYFKDAELQFANFKTTKLNQKTMIDPKWYSVWEIVNRGGANRNLSGVDLSNANLQGVDFEEANLTNANLSNSILLHSNLNRANLTNTDLVGANLGSIDLSNSTLEGTKLKAIKRDRDQRERTSRNTLLPAEGKSSNTSLLVRERPQVEVASETSLPAAPEENIEPKPKSGNSLAIAILGIMAVIGIGAIGGYVFLNQNPDSPLKQQLERLLSGSSFQGLQTSDKLVSFSI